jgi:hypothetical protein
MGSAGIFEEVAMKRHLMRITGILVILLMAGAASAGTWSVNKFFYEPDLGARGATEKSTFDTGLQKADAHLGKYKTLGDPSYSTLAEALTTIGSSTQVTLTVPAGAVPVNANTTIPGNIHLRVLKGADFQVANGVTLTIKGAIEAGPYQIFSWTGTGKIDLSDTTTRECSLTWWGAASGTSGNISAALLKATESIGGHNGQWLSLPKGIWRIATPTVIHPPGPGFRLYGQSMFDTQIMCDVGSGNVALTIGDISQPAINGNLEIGRLTFIGAANSCTNALKLIHQHDCHLDDINFWVGSTDYALYIDGCIWARGYVHVLSATYEYWDASKCAKPQNGILVDTSTYPYQSNVLDLRVRIGGVNGVGVKLDGTNYIGAVSRLTGSIEGYGSKPLWVLKNSLVSLKDLYIEGTGTEVLLDSCSNTEIQNLLINDGTCDLHFQNCQRSSLDKFSVTTLTIDADCRGVSVGSGTISAFNGLRDYAPDTQYQGSLINGNGGSDVCYGTKGHDGQNLFYNSLFTRWQSDRPDGGWSKDTHNNWTQCGTGLADTTNHNTQYCAKIVISGGDPWVNFSFDANQIQQMLGHWVNLSWWIKPAAGQNITNFPLVFFYPTYPDWQANTAYRIGDACKASGTMFVAVQAGTSGSSAPTWPANIGDRVTDGTVVWSRQNDGGTNNPTNILTANDIGKWKLIRLDAYVPRNATGGGGFFTFYRQAGGSDSTFYIAEPSVMTGRLGPRSSVPAQNEFQDSIQLGPIKITHGTVAAGAPTGWRKRGDWHLYDNPSPGQPPGLVCTADGSPATWKNMGNLGN